MQYNPVVLALSQSTDPHAQLPSFADLPSDILQDDGLEQVLVLAVQTKPVPFPSSLLVHAALPQMHAVLSAPLEVDPSLILQAEAVTPEARNRPSLLHVLSAAMQNIPVELALSQSTLPHAQADGLAAEPLVVVQTGPLRHLF